MASSRGPGAVLSKLSGWACPDPAANCHAGIGLPQWPLYMPRGDTEKAGGALRPKARVLSSSEETWGLLAGRWAGEVRAAPCQDGRRLLSVRAQSRRSEWQEWSAGGLGWAVSGDRAEEQPRRTRTGRSWRLRAEARSQTCTRSLGRRLWGSLELGNEEPCLPPGATVQGGGLGLQIGFMTVTQQAARPPGVGEPRRLAGSRTRPRGPMVPALCCHQAPRRNWGGSDSSQEEAVGTCETAGDAAPRRFQPCPLLPHCLLPGPSIRPGSPLPWRPLQGEEATGSLDMQLLPEFPGLSSRSIR